MKTKTPNWEVVYEITPYDRTAMYRISVGEMCFYLSLNDIKYKNNEWEVGIFSPSEQNNKKLASFSGEFPIEIAKIEAKIQIICHLNTIVDCLKESLSKYE